MRVQPSASMPVQRRQLLKAGGGAVLLAPIRGMTQSWPARPLRLVVPFAQGDLTDIMARLVGSRLAQELNQPLIIDNKPGEGGNVGATEVAQAVPDGYTLLMASPPLTISPALYTNLSYKPAQIMAVAMLGRVPNVLVVSRQSSINNVAELVAKAKRRPGQLRYASNGKGTSLHLTAELFKSSTDISITHTPYPTALESVDALLAGEVDVVFASLSAVLGQIQSRTVKALAVTTRRQSKTVASVPTLVASGLVDFDESTWFGLAAPTGTPPEAVARLELALKKVAGNAELMRSMEAIGAEVGFLGAAFMTAFMLADTAKWKRTAASAKITLG